MFSMASVTSARFQPTLLAFTRSDHLRCASCPGAHGFNPRSSRSRGATPPAHAVDAPVLVSTHAPRVHEERHHGFRARERHGRVSTHAPRVHEERHALVETISLANEFQPTLLAFTRSDHGWSSRAAAVSGFQPTLLAFTRSDNLFLPRVAEVRVSTHAPRVHEERRPPVHVRPNLYTFQPTLLACTRSDQARQAELDYRKFQPTLLAFTRSDGPRMGDADGLFGFNPRSSRSRGATKSKGERSKDSVFQPTLLAFTRSDCRQHPAASPGRAVSTHAPRVHEERLSMDRGWRPRRAVSTHAPRVHEERLRTCPQPSRHHVSTHAPRVHEERHCRRRRLQMLQPVSTHAPRVHEERPTRSPRSSPSTSFNPRSSRSRGATMLVHAGRRG